MEGLAEPQLPLVQGTLLMQALPVQPPGVYVTVVPQFPLQDEDWPAHGKRGLQQGWACKAMTGWVTWWVCPRSSKRPHRTALDRIPSQCQLAAPTPSMVAHCQNTAIQTVCCTREDCWGYVCPAAFFPPCNGESLCSQRLAWRAQSSWALKGSPMLTICPMAPCTMLVMYCASPCSWASSWDCWFQISWMMLCWLQVDGMT